MRDEGDEGQDAVYFAWNADWQMAETYQNAKEILEEYESPESEKAEQGNEYADFFLEHFDQVSRPNVFLSATRLLHHMGNIFRDNAPTVSTSGSMHIDRKRLQKLRVKKIALGHKPDDHEEEQNMGGMTMGRW